MPNTVTYNQGGYGGIPSLSQGLGGYFQNSHIAKRYYYKVYTAQGAYIKTWSTDVISYPTFRTVLNGGAGELEVKLARRYNNFGEGNDVTLMNKVELWVMDADNIPNNRGTVNYDVSLFDVDYWDNPIFSFRKIYTGYISAYSPMVDDETQYIRITLLGYVTEASYKIVKDPSGNTQFTLTAKDPATALQTIIDYYRADGNANLNYTGATIQPVGSSITYTFNEMTLQECINKIVEMTPYNYFWFIDPNGLINLKHISADADHKLVIGKDISYLESNRRAENIANVIYIIGGGSPTLYNKYSRTASISAYGKFERKLQDGNVTDNATADIMAKRYLDRFQDPETRAVIRIVDNNGNGRKQGLDIESFQVGDTIQIKNLNYGAKGLTLWDSAVFDTDVYDQTFQFTLASVLTIVSLTYYMSYIEIEVSSRLPEVTKRVEDVSKLTDQVFQEGIPVTPAIRTV